MTKATLYPRYEIAALRERGAKVHMLNGAKDAKGLAELEQLARKSDVHIILMWLQADERLSLYPILRERKNFSVVLEDWWTCHHWFIREADYVINRMYNGVAVRLGQSEFVTVPPPWFDKPEPLIRFFVAAAMLRVPALAAWPLVDLVKWWQRRHEQVRPEKMLYFPFTLIPGTLPLADKQLKYDFSITGSTSGVWLMRDAFASFKYTFANLYYDRKRLMDLLAEFDGQPFHIYDWRRHPHPQPPQSWEDYVQITRESRYVVATGGFHNAGLPKQLEYACLGTPMIGRTLPFEYPWLDECMIDLDVMSLTPKTIKPLLDEAMDRHPVLMENCLRWREQLFKLHDIHQLLDMLQGQADGKPVPPGYLKPAAFQRPAKKN